MYTKSSPHSGDRRYAVRKSAEKIKESVTIEAYLRDLGVQVKRDRAKCPIHNGDNPTSFSIDAEKRVWCCHACGEGGDLIDLCGLVEKHADVETAIVSLSMRFDVPLPERPPKWFEWQEKKSQIRDAAEEARREVRRRRLFRVLVLSGPEFEIEDEKERQREIRRAWRTFHRKMKGIGL